MSETLKVTLYYENELPRDPKYYISEALYKEVEEDYLGDHDGQIVALVHNEIIIKILGFDPVYGPDKCLARGYSWVIDILRSIYEN